MWLVVFFFQAEDGIRDYDVTGVQTCALPIFNRTALLNILAWCSLEVQRLPLKMNQCKQLRPAIYFMFLRNPTTVGLLETNHTCHFIFSALKSMQSKNRNIEMSMGQTVDFLTLRTTFATRLIKHNAQ